MEVFYLKINQPILITWHYLQMWLKIIQQFPAAKTYIICDKPDLQNSVEEHIRSGGGYEVEFIPSARDSEELKFIIDSAIVDNWKPAAYAHLTTFLHARDNGYKNFWNIDADDIGLYATPRKIAKTLKAVKDYALEHGIGIFSLDCHITPSNGENWSFGVSYVDNSAKWLDLLSKHCNDDAHTDHYKNLNIPNNADELTNYLRKVENVRVETFYVENLNMSHHGTAFFYDPFRGIRHWTDGRCYWHTLSESFGMEKNGSLPIPECTIKLDTGLTLEESVNYLKYSCSNLGLIWSLERSNLFVDTEFSIILPLSNPPENLRRCLGSLLSQNFTDFKLIVTDAGLAEDALTICREMKGAFGWRMKILTSVPKEKLFEAGLHAAKGRYIMFINGDDFFTSEALKFLHDISLVARADFVHTSNYFLANADDTTSIATKEPGWGDNFESMGTLQQIRIRLGAWVQGMIKPLIYNQIIRREFLEAEKISLPFDTEIARWIFSLQCLCLAENYVRVAKPLYSRTFENEPSPEDFVMNAKSVEYCKAAIDKIIDEVLYFDEYAEEKVLLEKMFLHFAASTLNKYLR